MQWLKKIFSKRSASDGVFVNGEKWSPCPSLNGFRAQEALELFEQMTPEQRLAHQIGFGGESQAVLAMCREESNRLRAEGRTVED